MNCHFAIAHFSILGFSLACVDWLKPFSDECATLANSISPLNPPILGDFGSSSPQSWGARGAKTAVSHNATRKVTRYDPAPSKSFVMVNPRWCQYFCGAIALILSSVPAQSDSARQQPPIAPPQTQTSPLRPSTTCPTELEPLTTALLRDLPSYINRLSHQRSNQFPTYAIAATQPNSLPLPVVSGSAIDPKQGGLHQTFFTVLEREYDSKKNTNYQHYHWLFLAHTATSGWQVAILYSRRGSYPATERYASPLRDTTQELTAQAVRRWLRDCQAGAVQSSSLSIVEGGDR